MTLADVLAAAAALVLVGAGTASLAMVLALLLPAGVGRARRALTERPTRSFLVGLFLLAMWVLVLGAFLQSPQGAVKLFSFLAVLAGLAVAALGGTGLAAHLGARSHGDPDAAPTPRLLLRGTALLGLSSLVPLLGWFLVLPSAIFLSLGSGLSAAWGRRNAVVAPATPNAPPLEANARI